MSSIAIYQDNDDVENQGIKRAAKKPGLISRAPLQERTVLGCINGPRVQPSRAAKVGHDLNAFYYMIPHALLSCAKHLL